MPLECKIYTQLSYLSQVRAFSSADSNRIKTKKIATNPQKHTASTSTNGHYSQAFVQYLAQTVEQLFIHKPKSSSFILYFLSLLTVGVASLSQQFAPQTVWAWGCRG
jgi:hypothetical protein